MLVGASYQTKPFFLLFIEVDGMNIYPFMAQIAESKSLITLVLA